MSIENEVAIKLRMLMQGVFSFSEKKNSEFTLLHNSLEMGEITRLENLDSPEKRKISKGKIKAYHEFFDQYKTFIKEYVLKVSKELVEVVKDLPEDDRNEAFLALSQTIQSQLNLKQEFFEYREGWLSGLSLLVECFDCPEGNICLDGDFFEFDNDDDLDRFNTAIELIDRSALAEQIWNEQRINRLRINLGK
jgi:hypothetical protein